MFVLYNVCTLQCLQGIEINFIRKNEEEEKLNNEECWDGHHLLSFSWYFYRGWDLSLGMSAWGVLWGAGASEWAFGHTWRLRWPVERYSADTSRRIRPICLSQVRISVHGELWAGRSVRHLRRLVWPGETTAPGLLLQISHVRPCHLAPTKHLCYNQTNQKTEVNHTWTKKKSQK